jgi:hypothetical protein
MSSSTDKTDKSPIATLTKNLDKDLSISPAAKEPQKSAEEEGAGKIWLHFVFNLGC